jgi:hypothetical protein
MRFKATGPLQVSNQKTPRPISSAFVTACANHGIARNDDFSSEREGAFFLAWSRSSRH